MFDHGNHGEQARRRRAFTAEFKAEIVELCQRSDRSIGQVAKDFDLTETAARDWVKQAARRDQVDHEIGAQLSVSVNTHIRSIYGKLQVSDRSSAVQRAREMRLLAAAR